MTNTPNSNAVPITPGNRYQSTLDLTECSTPASLSACNGFHDHKIGSVSSFDVENQRWHATLSRSRRADCYFLYGILTTKIFCRPSCASRRPSRRQVRFFSFPGAIEAAERAMFRPCKRCRPETLGTGNNGVLAISRVLRKIIVETFEKRSEVEEEGLKLESLAKSAGLSISHFHRYSKPRHRSHQLTASLPAMHLPSKMLSAHSRHEGVSGTQVQCKSHRAGVNEWYIKRWVV